MKTWIKMYPEMLHDRKMRKLTEREQLVFMKLLLLAGQEDKNGVLPADEDIALELYMKVTDVKKSLKTLIDAGLLTDRNGVTVVTNFEKRQETNLTGAEKVARYRERKRVTEGKVTSVTNEGYTCNPNVTDEGYIGNEKVTVEEEVEVEEDKEVEKELRDTVTDVTETRGKNPQSEKFPFGSQNNVMLTQREYAKLCEQLPDADSKIEAMSLYFASHGNAKKYKSHYATALNWARMAAERDSGKEKKAKSKSFADIAAEYEQRPPEPDPVWDIDL